MNSMRVILDTNVLVAGLRSRTGASHRILELMDVGKVTPVVSVPLMFEYEEVLLRAGMLPHLTAAEVQAFLDYLASHAEAQPVYFLWRPLLADADDDMIAEVALASQVDYIITNNVRDFAAAQPLGVHAMMPGEFLKLHFTP